MSSVEELKKIADKKIQTECSAKIGESVFCGIFTWFVTGWLAFGLGLLFTGFIKAVGMAIVLSTVGGVIGYGVWEFRIYRRIAREVNAELERLIAAAKASENES